MGLSPSEVTVWTIPIGVGEMVGAIVTFAFSEYFLTRRAKYIAFFSTGGISAAAGLAFSVGASSTVAGGVACLSLFYASFEARILLSMAYVTVAIVEDGSANDVDSIQEDRSDKEEERAGTVNEVRGEASAAAAAAGYEQRRRMAAAEHTTTMVACFFASMFVSRAIGASNRGTRVELDSFCFLFFL